MPRLSFILYASSKDWSGVSLPLVRKCFASISAKDFVSVQPMNQPSGKIFYLDFIDGSIVIIFDEELWWEDDDTGEWICPQIENDSFIGNFQWQQQRDEYLIIPKWEVDYQESGYRNEPKQKKELISII